MDRDKIEITNLHRQILYGMDDLKNVARYCGIEYTEGGISGIKKNIIWKYRCTADNLFF